MTGNGGLNDFESLLGAVPGGTIQTVLMLQLLNSENNCVLTLH